MDQIGTAITSEWTDWKFNGASVGAGWEPGGGRKEDTAGAKPGDPATSGATGLGGTDMFWIRNKRDLLITIE